MGLDNQREEWREVKNRDYEVSSLGRVRRKSSGRIIKPQENVYGYLMVGIYKDKTTCKRKYVHRLVADAFLDGYFDGAVIDHIDGDTKNNRPDNLRWVTQKQNIWDSYKRGKQRRQPRPVKQVLDGKVIAKYLSVAEAFKQTKIRHISEAACGKRRTAGGYQWEY